MENKISKIAMSALTAEATNTIRVRLEAQDLAGNPVGRAFRARVKVVNSGDYDGTGADNAYLLAVTGSSTAEWTHTESAGDIKDATFKSVGTAGIMDIDVYDASVETVTVYQGDPTMAGEGADVTDYLYLDFA